MLTRTHWPAVWAAIATGVIAAAYVGKLPTAIPLLRDEFGLTLVEAGWVNSTFNTLAVSAAVLFGAIAGRYGALRCCLAGLLAMMLGGVLGAAAGAGGVLIASRILEGAGFISVAVSAPALIAAAATPKQRNLALGLWSIYLPFGSSIAMLASPLLLTAFGWRGFWLAIVLATCVSAAALWRSRGAYAAIGRNAAPARLELLAALRQPGPWWLGLAFGCYALMYYAIVVWLPTFLVQERGASVTAAALLTAAVVVANVGGNLAGSWLIHRAAPRGHLISLAFAAMAVCACVVLSSALPDAPRAAACLAFMLVGGTIPAAVLSGAHLYAKHGGQISGIQGLVVQLSQIGPFFGPPLVAAVVSHAGKWAACLWVRLTAAALGLVLGQLAQRTERTLRPERQAAAG